MDQNGCPLLMVAAVWLRPVLDTGCAASGVTTRTLAMLHTTFDGPADDTLDLHGMTGIEAAPAVTAFLLRVRKRQPGALVHVITGRGRGSVGRPVLKSKVRTLLRTGTLPVAGWVEDLDGGGYLIRLKGR